MTPQQPRFLLDFTRAARGDTASVELPEGDQEYQLRGQRQSRPDIATLRWSPRLMELLDELREHTGDAVGEAAARVGRTLADFIDVPGWSASATQITALGDGAPCALTIRSNAAELYLLPWELVSIGEVTHAAFLTRLLIRYEWPDTATAPRLTGLSRTARGRVVFAWSAAGGKVDASRHAALITQALDDSIAAFDARDRGLDIVEGATCATIRAALERAKEAREPVAVLHILCHGGTDEKGSFGLVLGGADDPGSLDLVSASRVEQLLLPYAGLVRLVILSACDGGNAGPIGHALGSVAQALHRAGFAAVIASRFPLSWEGARIFAEALYDGLLTRIASLEASLLDARRALSLRGTFDWASLQLYAREADGAQTFPFNARPYRGLSAFAPEHTRLYFGRQSEVDELVREADGLIAEGLPRFMVVAGASGTGKSSLVMAGAIPRWMAASPPGRFGYVVVRPGGAPDAALRRIEEKRDHAAACERFVVVVDQFEEVFTHGGAATATAFARALWALATRPEGRVSVVLTIRVDFLGKCSEVTLDDEGRRLDKVACDARHQVLVAQMSPEQLREAIELPARAVGLALEAGLAELIVRDVQAEPGALPLMSHALYLLWLGREGSTLTRAAYEGIGSVQGALNTHAEARFAALRDDAEREEAQRLLLGLVNPGENGAPDTRRRCELDDLVPDDGVARERFERVVESLVDARLLVKGASGASGTVEIAHEALLGSWKRFRAWVDADRADLARLHRLYAWVDDWKRNPDGLLTGTRLGYAEEVAEARHGALRADARRLIEESRRAARRTRWTRRALVTTALATLTILSAVSVAQWKAAVSERRVATTARDRAMEQAAIARRARFTATLNQFTSRAAELRARADEPGLEFETLADAIDLRASAMSQFSAEAVPPGIDGALTQATLSTLSRLPLRGHAGEVRAVSFSSDGERVLTASADGTARVWGARDGHVQVTLDGHQGALLDARFSPDGTKIVTAPGRRGPAALWDARDGRLLARLGEGDVGVDAARFSPDGARVVVASGGAVTLWDARLANAPVRCVGAAGVVEDVAFSPDGARVVAASREGLVRVWDTRDGRLAMTLDGRVGRVASVAFSPDGARVVTAGNALEARVWDLGARRVALVLRGHTRDLLDARFSPDGRQVLTASRDHTVRLWDARDGALSMTLNGHRDVVFLATFAADGQRVVTASADGTARVWRARDGAVLHTLEGHAGDVVYARFSPDGARVATASRDRTARVWNLDASTVLARRLTHDGAVKSAEFSRDGAWVATTAGDGRTRVWGADDGVSRAELTVGDLVERARFSPDGAHLVVNSDDAWAHLWRWREGPETALLRHTETVRDAQFSPDGTHVVTASSDHTACFWNTRDASSPGCLTGHGDSVRRAEFSPDGARVLTASYDRTVRLWDVRSRAETARLSCGADRVLDAQFSPDGARVVTASQDYDAHLWTVAENVSPRVLRHHAGRVLDARFSPDGARVVTASEDYCARVWSTVTEERPTLLQGHRGAVSSVRFSPDGARVLTGSDDGTARIWNTHDGRALLVLRGHTGPITDLDFSPDGARVVTASSDRRARIWSLDPRLALRVGCDLLRGSPIWNARPSVAEACEAP